VIPAEFDYTRAASVGEAVTLLAEAGDDAKILAGGHSLLPMMKLRLAMPAVLVDIAEIPELRTITEDEDEITIGAATTHAAVAGSDAVRRGAPLLAHAAGLVGDPQIRHRGTIGGSLAHADPAADLPVAALALGAAVTATGPQGTRRIPIDAFFVGYFETALRPDEILTAVHVPRHGGPTWGYQKFTRRANDWAIVGVAATGGRIALAHMAATPVRAHASEQALAAGASVDDAAALADEGTEPGQDLHADAEYRRVLARVLTKRALLGGR
jgi:carbon-monoxide dehydrogenase medium subunit